MKSTTQVDMNKSENCLNSLDSSIITFTTHNFYSPKIIRISFPILKRTKKASKVYYFKITAVDDLLLKETERGTNLVISVLNEALLFTIT